MHILASHYRSEFLATPQLIRIDYAKGANGFEPTLLVKGSTLLLKYIVLGARLQLFLGRLNDRLLYALIAYDDPSKPVMLWSIVESEAEVKALQALILGEPSPMFLFNELALNVAWCTAKLSFPLEAKNWISDPRLGNVDYSAIAKQANDLLERAFKGITTPDQLLSADIAPIDEWLPVFNHFITSHGANSPIDLFSRDEGGQQEQLAVWLTDNLLPRGVYQSAQIPKGNGTRELTDILLSYEYGAILIESKALTVFNRETLPDRTKLAEGVSQHVEKAVRQLRGGIRRLKEGVPVTTREGSAIDVERSKPAHAIVLIPEFDLIEDKDHYGPVFIADFMQITGGFIHLLDIAELLRIVQAAEIISKGTERTPLMAFDYYLMERAGRTREAGTLCIQVLLRIQDEHESSSHAL